ncbi:phosphotransferase family protein [Novosphingobium aquimarinum]|uniref:phosphotransferase family protein n=1 Tax=Novosphingobium aquimarinum TaxID=2682494 RepID=UPI0018DB7E5C|nr:phosphotransferase family protein [Novosphingobium aquimarinum]
MVFPGEIDAGLTSSKLAFRTALEILLARECTGNSAALQLMAAAARSTGVDPRDDHGVSGDSEWSRACALLLAAERKMAAERGNLDGLALAALCRSEADVLSLSRANLDVAQERHPHAITSDRLEAYLRHRTGHGTLRVLELRHLMGGFGKETVFFSTDSDALRGEFVLRRDQPVELVPGACHRVRHEYAVIDAVRQRGFPAPDVLWHECDHPMMPGPDFFVMRKSEGATIGTLAGATSVPDPRLNEHLGSMLARLHGLGTLRELGDLTETIRSDLWGVSGAEAIRTYAASMETMLTDNPHAASPATLGVWRWLIANVPDNLGRSCLIHGDIGFHNMLMRDGELTCLLDWENAQIGHPGMDLGYVYNAAHESLDWHRVMEAYEAGGGIPLSERTLLFFRILMLARLVTTLNVGPAHLFVGNVDQMRLLNAEVFLRGPALQRLANLMEQYESAAPAVQRLACNT